MSKGLCCQEGNRKASGVEKIGSLQRPRCGKMSKEGAKIYSIGKLAIKDDVVSPRRPLARAESWEEIPSITLRIKRISNINFLGILQLP